MKVKLLKNILVGRVNDIVELPYDRANYLIRIGAALEWKQTGEAVDMVETVKKVAKKPVKKANVSRKKTTKKK